MSAARRAPRVVGAVVTGMALLVVGVGARHLAVAAPLRADRVVQATTDTTAATTSPSSTTTTSPPPPTVPPTVAAPPPPPSAPPPPPPSPAGGCAAALAYLAAHQAPGFVDTCGPGTAFGHYGVACWNSSYCPDGQKIVHIACPLPFVYMNEAHNSWTIVGAGTGIDPHGQGSPTEQAYCDRLR
jgi:hypothetical protein